MNNSRHTLSVRDLVVDFAQDTGTIRALDGVSLDLHAGRVLGVVGESGCGKSVTARAILRLIDRPGRIASGRVLLDPGSPKQQDLAALDPEGRAMRCPCVTSSSISSRTPARSGRSTASISIFMPDGCSAWSAKADAARVSRRAPSCG